MPFDEYHYFSRYPYFSQMLTLQIPLSYSCSLFYRSSSSSPQGNRYKSKCRNPSRRLSISVTRVGGVLLSQRKENVSICFVGISFNTASFPGQLLENLHEQCGSWISFWWEQMRRCLFLLVLPRMRNLFEYTCQCIVNGHLFLLSTENALSPSNRIPPLFPKYSLLNEASQSLTDV